MHYSFLPYHEPFYRLAPVLPKPSSTRGHPRGPLICLVPVYPCSPGITDARLPAGLSCSRPLDHKRHSSLLLDEDVQTLVTVTKAGFVPPGQHKELSCLSSLSPLTTLLPPGVSLLEGLELFFQVVQDTFTTNLVAGELDFGSEPL